MGGVSADAQKRPHPRIRTSLGTLSTADGQAHWLSGRGPTRTSSWNFLLDALHTRDYECCTMNKRWPGTRFTK